MSVTPSPSSRSPARYCTCHDPLVFGHQCRPTVAQMVLYLTGSMTELCMAVDEVRISLGWATNQINDFLALLPAEANAR